MYIAALCRVIAKPLKLRCSGGGLFAGSWVFAGRLLSPKPAGVAAGAAGNFRFGAPPACRNFCLYQADSVAALRVMPPFPRPPRFAEGMFYRWRIRKGRAERYISPRTTASRFFVASVEYARGMLYKVGFIFTCGDCDSVRMRYWSFPSENFTRAAGATHTCSARLTRSPFEVARMRGGKGRCI